MHEIPLLCLPKLNVICFVFYRVNIQICSTKSRDSSFELSDLEFGVILNIGGVVVVRTEALLVMVEDQHSIVHVVYRVGQRCCHCFRIVVVGHTLILSAVRRPLFGYARPI